MGRPRVLGYSLFPLPSHLDAQTNFGIWLLLQWTRFYEEKSTTNT